MGYFFSVFGPKLFIGLEKLFQPYRQRNVSIVGINNSFRCIQIRMGAHLTKVRNNAISSFPKLHSSYSNMLQCPQAGRH